MKIGFIYPGQGSQYVGMGKELYENVMECKEMIACANELLDFDLKHILFDENQLIHQTEYSQVCILVTSLCMYKALELIGITPTITAGLSLGEYCALVTSGVMTFEDAVKIVRIRGKLMGSAVPRGKGSMLAIIGLNTKLVEEVCADVSEKMNQVVSVANYNCPGQLVISGEKKVVNIAGSIMKEKGARMVVPLNVSAPFHTSLLKEAGEKLYEEILKYNLNDPSIPYVANVNAKLISNKTPIAGLLEKQVYSAVHWEHSIETMIKNEVDMLIEVGPGQTLIGFMKRIEWSGKVKHANQIIEELM